MLTILVTGALMTGPWEASPEVVAANEARRPEFAYDESEVPKYNLPSVIAGGVTAENWNTRRIEIVELIAQEMFGVPPCKLTTKVTVSDPDPVERLNAIHRVITVEVSHGNQSHSFTAHAFVPAEQVRPAPAFVLIDNRESIDATPWDGPESEGFWPVAEIIARGYATAAFRTDDVDPDRKNAHNEGLHALCDAVGVHDWGTLAGWAFGASLVREGLASLDGVDAEKIGVIGHSRGGKTALWAAASDDKFAIAVSNESGCGGAALSRRRIGETVKRINESFPYWFNDQFKTYNDREADLPFDQHFLISAVAPRAVYVGSADLDLWADPKGEYASLKAADDVFALFGDSAMPAEMPALGESRVVGRRGYHVRPGKHNLTALDWDHVLNFADQQFGHR